MNLFEELEFMQANLFGYLIPASCILSYTFIVYVSDIPNLAFLVGITAFYGSATAIPIIWANRIRKRILTAAAVRRLMQ